MPLQGRVAQAPRAQEATQSQLQKAASATRRSIKAAVKDGQEAEARLAELRSELQAAEQRAAEGAASCSALEGRQAELQASIASLVEQKNAVSAGWSTDQIIA